MSKKNESQFAFDFDNESVETLAEKQKKEQEILEAAKKAEDERKKAEELLNSKRTELKNTIQTLIEFTKGKTSVVVQDVDDSETEESEEETDGE